MIFRITGASVRAMCMAILIMLPAFILTGTSSQALEFTRIIATVAAIFVIYEYGFSSPSVIEFRYAAPYNRFRFLVMIGLVVIPSYIISSILDGTEMNKTLAAISGPMFAITDYSYSPVRIVANILAGENMELRDAIGQAIAMSVLFSLTCVAIFSAALYANLFRFSDENFNMWLNMPTYKSYEASSLQSRLQNSAFASMLIACLIPLFGPVCAEAAAIGLSSDGELAPIMISWFITIWIYFSASYLMRAATLAKVAMNREEKENWVTA